MFSHMTIHSSRVDSSEMDTCQVEAPYKVRALIVPLDGATGSRARYIVDIDLGYGVQPKITPLW